MNNNACVVLGVLLICCLAVPTPASANDYGMTWARSHLDDCGTPQAKVSCAGCDAYNGDTSCTAPLPILCLRETMVADPCPEISNFYNGWADGYIAITPPIIGSSLVSLAYANQLCETHLGPGWRMAEFHDGEGGWAFRAYSGSYIPIDLRFWVYINDQPANCWN